MSQGPCLESHLKTSPHTVDMRDFSTSATLPSSPPSSSPVTATIPEYSEDDEKAHPQSESSLHCLAFSISRDVGSLLAKATSKLLEHTRENKNVSKEDVSFQESENVTPSPHGKNTLDNSSDLTGISGISVAASVSHLSRKRSASLSGSQASSALCLSGQQDLCCIAPGDKLSHKKRKISRLGRKESSTLHSGTALSGAFRLQYAKGPGSLRRAESLRSHLSVVSEEDSTDQLESVLGLTCLQHASAYGSQTQGCSNTAGSIASPFGAYVPTVPTTPVAKGVKGDNTTTDDSNPVSPAVPVIAPPSYELIPRAALSQDEASERRITVLLRKEYEEREADVLRSAHPLPNERKSEDEEERSWTQEPDESLDEAEILALIRSPCAVDTVKTPPPQRSHRATISEATAQLDIADGLLERVVRWCLEVMPPDEYKTSYAPGDLYDLLSSSQETRFHACYLFLRYVLLASPSSSSSTLNDEASSTSSEDDDALEAVFWDISLACMALSVKFHRDVLFPLDVLCAVDFLDLASHEVEFEDLETAQRDVLEALSWRVGSATPGAFMEELWTALPMLRKLLAFDNGWEDVQEEAWFVLCDALYHPGILQYPISLITGTAVIEGIVEVLCKRYKRMGVDGRGRRVGKRDARSLRKAAMKCSRGVRLDIQDVLQITKDELRVCQKWLGLTSEM